MPSKLILTLNDISVSFAHATCFKPFSASVYSSDRIAIIGNNGTGKSTLLNIIATTREPSHGLLQPQPQLKTSYIPQTINTHNSLSGGERFSKALSTALQLQPSLLLLDEPTNHLDAANRRSLIKLVQHFKGAVICASHDEELLLHFKQFWHINQQSISIFNGNYADYLTEHTQQETALRAELKQMATAQSKLHTSLMKEQQRAAKRKKYGHKQIDQRKWPTVTSKTKATRNNTNSLNKQATLNQQKSDIHEKILALNIVKTITPKYTLTSKHTSKKCVLNISEGSVGYPHTTPILNNIYLTLQSNERLAITGANGSGKSTLLKGITNCNSVVKSGRWHTPNTIGYLDQNYSTLTQDTPFDMIKAAQPQWKDAEVRSHLNDFLFSKTEQVNQPVYTLSGGEKVRLCLAHIAAKPPELLVLDEITNNIDQETFEHIVSVLTPYPGALIIVSHNEKFINMLNIEERYIAKNGTLQRE